jgi:hypothetical protein
MANVAFTAAQPAGLLDCGVTVPDADIEPSPLAGRRLRR